MRAPKQKNRLEFVLTTSCRLSIAHRFWDRFRAFWAIRKKLGKLRKPPPVNHPVDAIRIKTTTSEQTPLGPNKPELWQGFGSQALRY